MSLTALQERAKVLGDKLGTLAKKDERTKEEDAELDRLTAEANEVFPQIEREIGIHTAQERAKTLLATTGSITEVVSPEEARRLHRGPAETEGRDHRDHRGVGQRFAESKEAKEWLDLGGPKGMPSARFAAGRLSRPRPGEPTYAAGAGGIGGPESAFALITGVSLPSFLPPPQILPGIAGYGYFPLSMRDVIAGGRTTTDTVYYIYLQSHTNAAAETAESSAFDPTTLPTTAAMKPEGAFTFNQASVPVATFAEWVPITKQTAQDAAQVQSFVESILLIDLERRINSQIANGNGTAPNIRGILQTTGIVNCDNAFFTATLPAIQDASAANAVFNRIERAITTLRVGTSAAVATFVAVNPYDFSFMRTASDANRQYFGGGPFVDGSPPMLWGLPLVQDVAIPQGTALVGDGTKAIYLDREDGNISYGWLNAQFVQNQLTILAEARGALAVIDPASFAKVALV